MEVNCFMGNLGKDNNDKLMELKSLIEQDNEKQFTLESLYQLDGKSLYHGTICEYEDVFLKKEKIDVYHGTKGTKDNGYGLYLTLNKDQAFEQGRRKQFEGNLKNKIENLNINTDIMVVEKKIDLHEVEMFFKNNSDKQYLMYKTLEIDENYGKFIINNRLGKEEFELFIGEMHNIDNKYALVYGGMADGKVGKLIQSYCDEMSKLNEVASKEAYQLQFLRRFLEEVNRPLKTGKGSQLSIHDNELFRKAMDVKDILKDS